MSGYRTIQAKTESDEIEWRRFRADSYTTKFGDLQLTYDTVELYVVEHYQNQPIIGSAEEHRDLLDAIKMNMHRAGERKIKATVTIDTLT